ncbi:coiled-coil and C2 domain-containing protein 1 [Mytilus galloprovincialis]|uniref:Coiled-coil and C2 domain-containing protein 1 n=1 Tax=Mytilus galloprovincialis TaxID=29158 RepID=A0A8B6HRN4_MYTGA|nr:coiled-coil and C2 domain-containing protein 1 [Mytilus galloprovincialis]
MIFLLILIIGTATGYDLKCPAKAQWRLKGNISCSSEDKYVCLFHLLEEKYMENCSGSDQSSIGSKLVFQPLFNLAVCDAGRYQPIVFTTHGNSDCIYSKSKCADEGQLVFSNNSSSADTACRCDYTQGYAFVTQPKNRCFCNPSDADCSCYRSTCTKLSAGNSNAHLVTYIIIASIVVCVFFAVIVLLKVGDFVKGEISTKTDGNETIDDVSIQTNENKTTDDETQKFIHELFLKGECGKLHFARLVFIGKNGVGKTSLMKRLLWHNKEDVTSTQSTDGIEVEKCNINIADGKWSPCNETDDDLTRLIHQVYKDKLLNATDESRRVSDKSLSTSASNSDYKDTFKDDTSSVRNESDDTLWIGSRIPDIHSVIPDNKNNHEAVEIDLNQIQRDNVKSETANGHTVNNYLNENVSDRVNDENINEMTSTIMKSCLKSTTEERNDMLAFCWLWDFAGQKDFYATHQVFLSKCAVYLLVTDSLEFSTAENQGLDFEGSAEYVCFWFDAIHCYWSTTKKGRLDPPIIVVCTNEDRFKEPSERKKRQRQFKDNLGQVLKDQEKKKHLRNIYFISNTEDVDIVFEEIRKEIYRQAMEMEDWGKICPLKWLLFQQVLLKLRDNNVPISSTKTLLKIAKHDDIGISEENEVKRCLKYCNDNGTVIYFDEENLADHVILNPKWLIKAFRCLVSDKIDNVIEVSDDWQQLKDTGQLTDSLISSLFRKEPNLKFENNKAHLIEVMKRFDIIVNLKDSTTLYMPCMIKACSFSEVQKHFSDGSQSITKTSWLCLEFKFLPPAFFNHIIAWYVKKYNVSYIIDKECRSKRNALYRQVGVFDLDLSRCEQLVVCKGHNTIALQVWHSRMSKKTYGNLGSELFRVVETLQNRYSLHISYIKTFTCYDGDFTIQRKTIDDLLTEEYRCFEHKKNHKSDDLVKPWDFSEQLT